MQFDKDGKCKSSIVMQFIKEFTAKGFNHFIAKSTQCFYVICNFYEVIDVAISRILTQLTLTLLKVNSTIEKLEKGVKYVQS